MTDANISEQEAQIYDRQIRLWGVDAQNRMRASRVLLVNLGGLNAEIAKNIVLSGVGNVSVLDFHVVTERMLGSQFLVSTAPEAALGHNRGAASVPALQQLNPLVKVSSIVPSSNQTSISNFDEQFFASFDLVFLSGCTLSEQLYANDICRRNKVLFFAGDCFGLYALMFLDLLPEFSYTVKDKKDKTRDVQMTTAFVSLRHALETVQWGSVRRLSKQWAGLQVLLAYRDKFGAFPQEQDFQQFAKLRDDLLGSKGVAKPSELVSDDFLRTLQKHAQAELNPVCAIFGGIAAQEIIKAISRNADPVQNYFVYDGLETSAGFMEKIVQLQ